MSGNQKIILFVVVVVLGLLAMGCHWLRSKTLLKEWARANGYELVQMRINWSQPGPFLFRSRRQEVYQIKVRDQRGRLRRGWAKCGGYWFGFLVNKVEVIWD